MEYINDPYDDAKEDVERLFKEAEALWVRLRELGGQEASKSTVNDEIQWILRELAPCVADLTENLQQLGGAVQMMESKKGTFKVDPTELAKRKEWLQTARQQLQTLNNDIQQTAVAMNKGPFWDSLKQRVMLVHGSPPQQNQQDPVASIKANLDVGQPSSKAKGKAQEMDLEAHNDAYHESEKFVDDQLALQQMQLQQQDEDLDVLHQGIKKLGQVGMSIRDELGQHAILLDELDEESNALQSKLRLVHKKMDKVTAEMSQKSKLCVILALVGILFVLLFILLET
jgi:flagellar motility protein MotE (MotC chaperone)